jgi:hypothetical protein
MHYLFSGWKRWTLAFLASGARKDPRVLRVQYQNIKGTGLDQFKKAGTQIIIYPTA